MKKALYLMMTILLASCMPLMQEDVISVDYQTIEVDSCEYIVLTNDFDGSVYTMTHKGNCKFCKERNKEE